MISKPQYWEDLWGADGTTCSYQITIGDVVYSGAEDIEDKSLKVYKPVFTANSLIGNTPCFSMECCLRSKDTPIPRGATLQLQVRLKNGPLITDFIPMGTFKIYKRHEYADGWIKLTCRDKMQMANQPFFAEDVGEDSWPKPMLEVMESTSARLGLTLDPRTVIMQGPDWMVTPPANLSIRAVWSYIAAAHGGNFIITPEETLLLVVPKATGPSPVEVELTEKGFELLGDQVRVDQVGLQVNSEYSVFSGESGENNILAECPYANQVIADYVKSQLTGPLFYPMKTSDMLFDPLAEVQDSFLVQGLATIWSDLTIVCGITPLCDGTSESMVEPDNEYGFEDTPLNSLKVQISGYKQYADEAAQGAVNSLGQQEIFDRLTGGGVAKGIFILDGQLYINASYIGTGVLSADLIKAGILQSVDGESFVLDLTNGTVRMKAVDEVVRNLDNYKKTQATVLETLADGLKISISETISSQIVDGDGNLQDQIDEILANYRFTIDGQYIGRSDAEAILRLSAGLVEVLVAGTPTSTFDRTGMNAEQANIKTLNMGDYTLTLGKDNHLTLF